MNVAIVDPTRSGLVTIPTLGVMYVAAALEAAGHTVSIHMRSVAESWDTIGKDVGAQNPDLVGVGCLQTFSVPDSMKTVKMIRNECDAPIMMGGLHPSLEYKKMLETCPEIDVVVLGEGEPVVVDIAHAVECGEPFSTVKGTAYREHDRIKTTERRPVIKDLDALPFPARHLVHLHKFQPSSRGNMYTSRGCPYHCVHCCVPAIHGVHYRTRSPENVVAEMKELVEKHDIHYSKCVDEGFMYNTKRVQTICDLLIAEDVDMTWGCKVRSDKLSMPLLKKMKKANCQELFFTFETANQKTLDMLGKKENVPQIEKAILMAKEAGLKIALFIHIGLPFETKEDVMNTLQFMERMHPDRLGIQVLDVGPGCTVYEALEDYGITLMESDALPDYDFNPAIVPTLETSELSRQDMIDLTMEAFQLLRRVGAESEVVI